VADREFSCLVDGWQTGNNIALTIYDYEESPAALTQCAAQYVATNEEWMIQLTYLISSDPAIQLDALVFWPETSHAVGAVSQAEAQVKETTYESSDPVESWMRAFFEPSDSAVTLTAAGTTTGSTISGTIDFAGYAYTAELNPDI
jgi:hypothetical protein